MKKTILLCMILIVCIIPNQTRAFASTNESNSTLVLASDTVTVNNLDSLKTAVQMAVGNRLVLLQDNIDAAGYYDLAAGLIFPMTKGDLTLKAAVGNTPVVRGTFKSTSGTWMILNKLTIDGITLDGNDASAQAFIVSNRDTVMNLYTIKNCTFKNQKGNQFWYSNGSPALIQEVLVENNLIENFGGSTPKGSTGGTFVQLQNKNVSRNDNFTFRKNTFTNWHGNQFFNSARQTTTVTTGINVTFENNTFYNFGGNATSVRNFVEWGNVPKWYSVNGKTSGVGDTTILYDIPFTLNIRNNFFYGNQTDDVGKIKIVKLFAPNSEAQPITLNFQKNVYDPNEVGFQLSNTTRTWTDSTSNTIAGLGITTEVFVDKALASSNGDLTMYKQTALYTYGIGGVNVGDPRWYTSDANPSTKLKELLSTKLEAYSDASMVYVKGTLNPVTLYNVLGHKIGTYKPAVAESGINVNRGLVFVSTSEGVVKVMVK